VVVVVCKTEIDFRGYSRWIWTETDRGARLPRQIFGWGFFEIWRLGMSRMQARSQSIQRQVLFCFILRVLYYALVELG
jgi:hypothetical protein